MKLTSAQTLRVPGGPNHYIIQAEHHCSYSQAPLWTKPFQGNPYHRAIRDTLRNMSKPNGSARFTTYFRPDSNLKCSIGDCSQEIVGHQLKSHIQATHQSELAEKDIGALTDQVRQKAEKPVWVYVTCAPHPELDSRLSGLSPCQLLCRPAGQAPKRLRARLGCSFQDYRPRPA